MATTYFDKTHVSLDNLKRLCGQETVLSEYPVASGQDKNVLIYEGDRIRSLMDNGLSEKKLKAELNKCLNEGPGVLVIKGVYRELSVIDNTTDVFMSIIEEEKRAGKAEGDHFGSNERIWNSLQKLCLRDPALFIAYFGEPILALISNAWLGPFYQITAQVNNVKPGSASQSPHRDYHLGFQSDKIVAQFPAQIQVMSQYLTLQGAIAHTDMPLEAGPTLFLPFSQQFLAGYMAYRDPSFVDYFKEHYVQLPLEKGDAVYFSPALFHGAGTNTQTTDRLANLVQISSAFGRPMETVDRYAMIEAVYPILLAQQESLGERKVRDTIAATADGYSFPTNLDSDPPVGGNAPKTAQDFMWEGLRAGWNLTHLQSELRAYRDRRVA